jgi:hypothetical protein
MSSAGVEVQIAHPLGGTVGFVYLFPQDGLLDPGASVHYVDYDFNLLSGNYKDTYKISQRPNPENSFVAAAYYERHFSDRWKCDGPSVFAGTITRSAASAPWRG